MIPSVSLGLGFINIFHDKKPLLPASEKLLSSLLYEIFSSNRTGIFYFKKSLI